ncbi:pseudouridine synthase [Limnohabitans sp.]|uniref:pseudouridine synthase n=1 Tax=Limnohabitans sp. TaxID=1907725 RepID=UPI0039BC9247|nr:pseudouridine synthase [Comamonadaceae bacterium]
MNDQDSKDPKHNAGVYAKRQPGAMTQALQVSFKPIALADVVSGQFDEDEGAESLAEDLGKRVLAPQSDSPKLHKVLAQAGMGSRLEMEKLITEGRIAVNNEPAHVGQRVQYGDQIKVDGKPIRIRIDPPPARVIAYHKPAGEIVSHDDPQNRPSVFRKLPRLQNGKWQSVGRLDLNTEGLLLFTSSGELANQLMHPRFGLEREYAVRVLGALSKDEKHRLLDGVMLDDGPAQFGSIEDGGGEGSNCWYRVTISEGRNREVRRMMESVGHAVSRLIRIRYGAMVLPHGLRRGAWLELDEADIRSLMRAAGTSERPRAVTEPAARTNRNDRRPRTGGQGRAGTAVPRAKPAAKPNQSPGGSGLHSKADAPKSEAKYIGAESFNRLKKVPGGPGRGGRGAGSSSR